MMTRGAVLVVLCLAACGDDGGGAGLDAAPADAATDAPPPPPACEEVGGAACFDLPRVEARRADDTAPSWDCVTPAPVTSAAPITVTGTALDFQNDTPIPTATIAAFDDLDFATPVATATADANGVYSIVLPAGQARSRMNWRTQATGWLDTYSLNFGLDVSLAEVPGVPRLGISETTADGIAAFIQVERTPALGVLAGGAVDCERKTVKNVIATVSSTSSKGDVAPSFVACPQVYYFSAGSTPFPVRRTSPENRASSDNGLFLVVELPPTRGTSYYLQTWGFRTAADVALGSAGLSLLSELEAPVVGGSVITAEMSANQGSDQGQ